MLELRYTVGVASAQVSTRPLTAEQFYELPEPEEGGKMELIDGRVALEMPVNGPHGDLVGSLMDALRPFARSHGLGKVVPEVGFLLKRDPDRVRAPDVAFVSASLLEAGGWPAEGYIPYPPSFVIEVISPSNFDADIALKVEHYLEAGVERVWVVRPKTRTVTIHLPDHTSRTLLPGSSLTSEDAGFAVPGFELALEALFAEEA